MQRSIILFVSFIFLTGLGFADSAYAQKRVLLGERHVTDRAETDTVAVGKSRGAFTGLQIKASGSPVEFKRIVIHFENGASQTFEKNRILRKGEKSRIIDLEGGSRLIDKVVFHYEARSKGWKGAEIRLWGVR